MFGITDLTTYVLGVIFIILLPGPNSLFVLTVSSKKGMAQGLRAGAGVLIGDTILMLLVVLGAATVLKTNPLIFVVLKLLGAGYLGWLGLQLMRSVWVAFSAWRKASHLNPNPQAALEQVADVDGHSRLEKPLLRALGISLLNPKAILFFLSFFLQFADPKYPDPAITFLALGLICQFFSCLYLLCLIVSGSKLAAYFSQQKVLANGLTLLVGVMFIGFALQLAFANVH